MINKRRKIARVMTTIRNKPKQIISVRCFQETDQHVDNNQTQTDTFFSFFIFEKQTIVHPRFEKMYIGVHF